MRLLTGIKPTGSPHLGNYVGAIRPALELLSEGHEGFYFIADYHALTTERSDEVLRSQIMEVTATWLAFGLDLSKSQLYMQSDLPEICELQWILGCITPKGLMNRGHAYKAHVQENKDLGRDVDHGVNMGSYSYPVLMAADILAPQADGVPVGRDQLQHVEVTRDLVSRFHSAYKKNVFTMPEAKLWREEKVLLGVDGRKMSKSYGNDIPLFLPLSQLRKKIMKIPTDSSDPHESKEPEGLLFEIYRSFAAEEETQSMMEAYRGGISWGEVKESLYKLLERELAEPRQAYEKLMADDRVRMLEILKAGASVVAPIAQETLLKVKDAVGVGS